MLEKYGDWLFVIKEADKHLEATDKNSGWILNVYVKEDGQPIPPMWNDLTKKLELLDIWTLLKDGSSQVFELDPNDKYEQFTAMQNMQRSCLGIPSKEHEIMQEKWSKFLQKGRNRASLAA